MISDITCSICTGGGKYTKEEILDYIYQYLDPDMQGIGKKGAIWYCIIHNLYNAFACRTVDNTRINDALALYFAYDGQLTMLKNKSMDSSENAFNAVNFDWEKYFKNL